MSSAHDNMFSYLLYLHSLRFPCVLREVKHVARQHVRSGECQRRVSFLISTIIRLWGTKADISALSRWFKKFRPRVGFKHRVVARVVFATGAMAAILGLNQVPFRRANRCRISHNFKFVKNRMKNTIGSHRILF